MENIKEYTDFINEGKIQEKEGILEGLKQVESGQVIPHEVVMKNIKKKYGIM